MNREDKLELRMKLLEERQSRFEERVYMDMVEYSIHNPFEITEYSLITRYKELRYHIGSDTEEWDWVRGELLTRLLDKYTTGE